MRDYKVTVEFTTPSLATWSNGGETPGKPGDADDKFKRMSDGRIVFEPTWLFAAVTGSIANAGRGLADISPRDIQIDPVFSADTQIRQLRPVGGSKARETESIATGTQVTFDVSTADHVTKSKLERIVTVMGKIVGISPFGHAMGYGRFILIGIDENNTDCTDEAVWSPSTGSA